MPIKKSTYSVGDKVQVRLFVGYNQVWLSGKIIDRIPENKTYDVELDSDRVVRDIEPKDLRKG